MLKSLYDYANRKKLVPPEGYITKTVKAYILLYGDGTFQDIEICENESVLAPDIGSLANGTDKCNVLLEKRSIVVPEEESKKSVFFLETLREGGKKEPKLAVCANAIGDKEILGQIRECLEAKKVKPSDRISFKVDYQSVLNTPETIEWWKLFRLKIKGDKQKNLSRCLITGNLAEPLVTTMPINGLHVVGGHARGDALICFDKSAYCSFDLKKALNAPVSEEAFAAVKAALDDLLLPEKAPILAGMKFVHWYDQSIEPEEDPLIYCGDFMGFDFEEEDEADEEIFGESEDAADVNQDNSEVESERSAEKAANALIHSVTEGTRTYMPDNVRYYILMLSGVNGRVMIRRYENGNYKDLQEKLNQWHDDLALVNPDGKGLMPSCKLSARLIRLMKRQKKDSKPFKRMEKELSGITPAVISAIISGNILPDSVAIRALSNIRSFLMDDDADERERRTICYAYQWLKVWLIRNRKKGESMLKEYNPEYDGIAYHCGAMMAVYEKIQKLAMPKVNVTVAQRYYASAMQTPALVMGTLSKMSIHHIEKIKSRELANEMTDRLKQISSSIHGKIPSTMNLEQQSEFALGYYQMGAEMNRVKDEKAALKKAKEETKEETE